MKVDSASWPALSRDSNPLTQDVCILYQGGSGGFALYYYLLLSGNFQHSIDETWEMINHQFSPELMRDRSRWKTQEIWPNNHELKQLAGRKLFLVCNPFWGDYNRSIPNDTFKIFLYADLHLQLRLAWEKQAWWFTDETRRCTHAPDNNQVYLRQIIKDADTFNGQPVDPAVPKIIQEYSPDQIINLKEFAHGKNIIDPPNTHQLKFLDHWIRLQSKKSLRLMYL
jgi:hypothetical protein